MEEKEISLYVYDQEFNLIGICDKWISLIWTSIFNGDIGGFDLQIPATEENINIFQPEFYICRSDKLHLIPTSKAEGGKSMTQFNDIHIIEAVEIEQSDDGNHILTIGGVQITEILKRRVIKDPYNISDQEFFGFWEALERNAFTPNNRGLPVERLKYYYTIQSYAGYYVEGDLIDCQNMGYLSTFTDQETTTFCNLTTDYPTIYAEIPRSAGGMLADSGILISTGRAVMFDRNWGSTLPFNPYPVVERGAVYQTSDNIYFMLIKPFDNVAAQVKAWDIVLCDRPKNAIVYPYENLNGEPISSNWILQSGVNIQAGDLIYIKANEITLENPNDDVKITPHYLIDKNGLDDANQTAAFFIFMAAAFPDLLTDQENIFLIGWEVPFIPAEYRTEFQLSKKLKHESFYDILNDVCTTYDVGLALYPDSDISRWVTFHYAIYDGEERDVVFSQDFENLISSKLKNDLQDYKNLAFISAKYPANPSDKNIKEIDLVTYTPQGIRENINRREIFLESDISYRDGDDGIILQIDQFRNSLIQEGAEALAGDNAKKTEFDCEILANSDLYQFNRDYFIGDIINIVDIFGYNHKARVQEAAETFDNEKGYTIDLKLVYLPTESLIPQGVIITDNNNYLITDNGDYLAY